jgi:23S rRNA (pseudouridine1915-N3)-methyltransferase
MVIRLVAVGRVRDAALREACNGYAARLKRYLKLEIIEVREAGLRDPDAERARRVEGDALRRAIPPASHVVALTRTGEPGRSEDLAARLGAWQEAARDVVCLIGGAHGIDDSVLAEADERLSLSPLTLPHDIARLVTLEQLYRACTIRRGEPYHKGGS